MYKVQGNPVKANVDAGIDFYKTHGCDGVVAFGGYECKPVLSE